MTDHVPAEGDRGAGEGPVRYVIEGDAEKVTHRGRGRQGPQTGPTSQDAEGHAPEASRHENEYRSSGQHSTGNHSPVSIDRAYVVPIKNIEYLAGQNLFNIICMVAFGARRTLVRGLTSASGARGSGRKMAIK